MVSVYKLGDLQFKASYTCIPRQAVIAAHAQFDCNDFNTWSYGKYESLISECENFITCGNYSTYK